MKIELVKIQLDEKPQLELMLLDYFKEIDTSKIQTGGEGEQLDYPYLDLYWKDENRIPLKIKREDSVVGFVLINDWIICETFKAEKSIAEFYIRPAYRRKGIGQKVAFELFKKYKGKWELRESRTNLSAIKFWRSIIGSYTNDHFEEIKTEEELIQLFES